MNVNISDEFNFSEFHGAMNHCVASKVYMSPSWAHSLASDPQRHHLGN